MSIASVLSGAGDRPWHVEQGDVLATLARIPSDSVHCIVTSPPYWGQRDYDLPPTSWGDGWVGCLGLEPSPDQFIVHMQEIGEELRRVLHPLGTLWLNLGDSYNGSGGEGGDYRANGWKEGRAGAGPASKKAPGLKRKDLVGLPWRVALALQADGWWLRRDIVWYKRNPNPESAPDRPHTAHEYIFLMSRSEHYFYDAESVAQPSSGRGSGNKAPGYHHGNNAPTEPAPSRHLRSVWDIPTEPFPDAHFATFPTMLPELCIKAGSSWRGCCIDCAMPWSPIVAREGGSIGSGWNNHEDDRRVGQRIVGDAAKGRGDKHDTYQRRIVGWEPGCQHGGETIPCVVLDPFSGSGTTGVVARRLSRRYIGIELSEEYARMSEQRIADALLPKRKRPARADRPGQLGLIG